MNVDELVYRRVLHAARSLVWQCLTEPAELTQFWGPRAMTTPLEGIVVELRVGGRFETRMVGDGGSHQLVATFTEVVTPERLAWMEPASGMHTTVSLTDLGDGTTEVVIHQRHVPEPIRSAEARAGFLTSLDKLEEHLARLTRQERTVTDLQALVAPTYDGLADLLADAPGHTWDAPSLCERWQVRHVIAHMTMPARLTPEQFAAEMAAAGGDFTVLSDAVAERDAILPLADHLTALRSPLLHAWQPPGSGPAGALSHAVIHSLDVTVALGRPPVASQQGVVSVLDQLTGANGALFGLDLTGTRLEAADTDWSWGTGTTVRADSDLLVALLSGRTLPDGRTLQRSDR